MSIKDHKFIASLQKMMLNNPNVDLVNDNVYTKFDLLFGLFVLKILSKTQILRYIKGCNSYKFTKNDKNPKRGLVNVNEVSSMLMCKQNLVKFCLFVLKILSENEIGTE